MDADARTVLPSGRVAMRKVINEMPGSRRGCYGWSSAYQRSPRGSSRATTMNQWTGSGSLSGAAYVLLANLGARARSVGAQRCGIPDSGTLDEQQRYAENPSTNVAIAMVILAQMALMMFIGYLCSRVRDAGWLDDGAHRRNRRARREFPLRVDCDCRVRPSGRHLTGAGPGPARRRRSRTPGAASAIRECSPCCFCRGTGDPNARAGAELGRHRSPRHEHRRARRNRASCERGILHLRRSCWSVCG